MFIGVKGDPNFININVNVLHFGNCKSDNIGVDGYHDSAASRLQGKKHMEFNACIHFFLGTVFLVCAT